MCMGASRPPPSHPTGQTGHVSGGAVDAVRVLHPPHPERLSRRARRAFLPADEPRSPPRRRPSRHATAGHDARPPCGPSAGYRAPTLPSAACGEAGREAASALRPSPGHPAALPRSAVRPSGPRRRLYHVRPSCGWGLRGGGPTRPARPTPPLRCVSRAPPRRATRPSDPTSRGRPGAALVLRLHVPLDRGLSPPSMTACTAHTRYEPHASARRLHADIKRGHHHTAERLPHPTPVVRDPTVHS
jgi:hypothetical protein